MPKSAAAYGSRKPPFGSRLSTHQLIQNLVVALPFTENIGPVYDHGPYRGVGGAATMSGPTWSLGPFGRQVTFSGAAEYIELGEAIRAQINPPISIVAWIQHDGTASDRAFVGWAGSTSTGTNGYVLRLDTTHHLVLLKENVSIVGTDTTVVPSNVLTQVGLTYNGENVQFYVEGAPTANPASTTTFSFSADFRFQISGQQNASLTPFDGSIAALYIWNRILSASEIRGLNTNPYLIYAQPFWNRWGQGPVTVLIHPTGQVSIGNWTTHTGATTGLATVVDEDPYDDADYIQSGITPSNDTVILSLPVIADPMINSPFTVRIRLSKAALGNTMSQVVTLQAGTTDIATGTFSNISATITEVRFSLTSGEVDSFRSNNGFNTARIKIVANQT